MGPAHSQTVPQEGYESSEIADSIGIGLLMDPVQKGKVGLGQFHGDGLIGGQHEFFNKLVGKIPFSPDYI